MNERHRIVVGYDFTETGGHGLDEAIRYAAALDEDELHVVYALGVPSGASLDEIDRALDEAADRLREEVVEHCERVGRPWEEDVVFHVRPGDPVQVIQRVAADVEASLIVVGTHGRRGVSRMLLGSVAERLVRTTRAPVLVGRPNELASQPKDARIDPAVDGEDMDRARVFSERLRFGRGAKRIAGLV
ncbi:MAG TPA: universal stress protein [Sandaracinaceae bacterium LLY-WYZ-13_1]|nr:universal stress protein [Sandaracinaceae bacterium LLY-WYZ-13_1]